jgi:hypothetical protein
MVAVKRDDFDVVFQLFDIDQLVVVHGTEIAVEMGKIRLKFTHSKHETIAEPAILGIFAQSRFGTFPGHSNRARIDFEGCIQGMPYFWVALATVRELEVNRT